MASHRTAAALHGWELAHPPPLPEVVVPRGRKVDPARRHGVEVRWRAPLEEHEVHRGIVTEVHRTVIDCARDLPFAEALAIADSALRRGQVDHDRLVRLATSLPSAGRAAATRVVGAADGRAANPFESVLRAIALDVPGLVVEPQTVIVVGGQAYRPDLVDLERRLVLEADSFEWHGSRKALVRDCERYNALVNGGWTVLRFSWEHTLHRGDYVRDCLLAAVGRPRGRTPLSARPPSHTAPG